jgi:hypothetical protein
VRNDLQSNELLYIWITLIRVDALLNFPYRYGLGFFKKSAILDWGLFWNILLVKHFLYYSYIISTSPNINESYFLSFWGRSSIKTFLSISNIYESLIEWIVYFILFRTCCSYFIMSVNSCMLNASTKKSILLSFLCSFIWLPSAGYKEDPTSSWIERCCFPVRNSLKRMPVTSTSLL